MEYRTGNIGRVVVVRFSDGDDVLGGITEIAKNKDIKSGIVYFVGGMRGGKFVVGPQKDELPPVPMWRELGGEPHETFAIGTIFPDDEGPKVHMHGAFAKGDTVKVGCVREDSKTFLVLEAVILEITGIDAKRELDPESGMKLLKL